MEQTEFLDQHVFKGLKNVNESTDQSDEQHFSEADFEIVLDKAEHFGIGIYNISSFQDGKVLTTLEHEEFKKKATDPKWYKKAFLTSRSKEPGLTYAATYKVSSKLLAKYDSTEDKEQ